MVEITGGLTGLGIGIYILAALEEYTLAGLLGIGVVLGGAFATVLGLERLGFI